MKLKNTALLTGLVRNPSEYREKINTLVSWRDEGIIDDIVVSTWLNELALHGSLRDEIIASNIRLVEISPPEIGPIGHTWHQMKTLAFGLDACAPGGAVFKLRADKIPLSGFMKEAVSKRDFTPVAAPPGWPVTLRCKIKTAGGIVTQPFFLNDMIFYGIREDLLQLISFDLSLQMSGALMNPEQVFFSAPFTRLFPIFNQFFRVNWGLLHADEQFESAKDLISKSLYYPFYRKAMLTWLLICVTYFETNFLSSSSFADDAYLGWTIEEFFDIGCQKQRPGVDYHNNIKTFTFGDVCFANALLNGRFAPSPLMEKFEETMSEIVDYKKHTAYKNLFLGLEPEAMLWAEFVRSNPVGYMSLDSLKPVSDSSWLVHTPLLNLRG